MKDIVAITKHFTRTHKPELLTSGGVVGTLATAYLSGRASWTAAEMVMRTELESDGPYEPLSVKERLKLVATLYIPTGITCVLTVASIVGANKVQSNRFAALGTAYALTERSFEDYKAKVIEQMGPRKEEKVRDAIAQDKVTASASNQLVLVSDGNVMCYELRTGRYFESSMEKLRRAQNDLNHEMMSGYHIQSLNTWYDMIGLGSVTGGDDMGWDADTLMEIRVSTTLSEDDRPCLAIDYNYVKNI